MCLKEKITRDGVVFLCDLGAEQNSAYHWVKIEVLVRLATAMIIKGLN